MIFAIHDSWEISVPVPQSIECYCAQDLLTTNALYEEALCVIFEWIARKDLIHCPLVCKKWQRIIHGDSRFLGVYIRLLHNPFKHSEVEKTAFLKTIFSKLNVIDEQVWREHVDVKAYNLTFGNVSPLDLRKLFPLLSNLSKQATPKGFFKSQSLDYSINQNKGVTLITLPKGLNGKTIRELLGRICIDVRKWDEFCVTLSASRVLITNDIFNVTRSMPRKKAEKVLQKMGYSCPEILSICIVLLFEELQWETLVKQHKNHTSWQESATYIGDKPDLYFYSKLCGVSLRSHNCFRIGSSMDALNAQVYGSGGMRVI